MPFPLSGTDRRCATSTKSERHSGSFDQCPCGEWENGQRGLASLPDAGEPFRHSVRLAREYAVSLGCKQIHIMAGNREESITFDEQYALLIERLRYAADYLMADNIRVLIEPLNNDNMPGYFISSFPLAEK